MTATPPRHRESTPHDQGPDSPPADPGSGARHRGASRWLRVMLPTLLILIWLAGAAIGGPYFGRVSEVSSNEQANYLPASADATKVQALLGEFRSSDAIPAIVVFTSGTKLTKQQVTLVNEEVATLPELDGVDSGVSPAILSQDGLALQAFVPVKTDSEIGDVVTAVGDQLRDAAPQGVAVHVTGPAGFTADLIDAFSGIDGLLLGVALLAVFIILVVVYRSCCCQWWSWRPASSHCASRCSACGGWRRPGYCC